MNDLSALFFNPYSVFFPYFGGELALLGRTNTRVYTKLLPEYLTVHKCAGSNKPIFHLLEQVKVKFFLGGGFHKHPGWCLPL